MRKILHIKGTTQTIVYWITLVSLVFGGHLIAENTVSVWWLLLSFLVYMWFTTTITVGYHRLFAHRAFECSRVWHFIFGFTGVVMFQGSALSWAAVHHAHHKYADTPLDSHITDWRWWLGRQYGPILKTKKVFLHLMRDKMHMRFHRYGLLYPLGFVGALSFTPYTILLYGYLVPLGVFFIVSNFHQSFSHFKGKPRNQPWLEFILPASGEWTHAAHHKNPRAWRFGRVDLGASLISAIRYEKCA